VSSFELRIPAWNWLVFALLLVAGLASEGLAQHADSTAKSQPRSAQSAEIQQLFEQGEAALRQGDLPAAEQAFRGVLARDPQVAGAYANLGVVYMRRKQWRVALEVLEKAEHLAPQVAGIRLNIGLVHYRQNDFRNAIPAFESVVRDVPDSYQARYLLGLCYFFVEDYPNAVGALEPLWATASGQLNYLYVLGVAAGDAGRPDLEQRALGRLIEIGEDSPEFHLLVGKAHLNRKEYDDAITELNLAAKAQPNLPFLHFNLGMAYLKKQDLDEAKAEFLKDAAVEPDVVYNYDQLGLIDYLEQQDPQAEKMFHKALQLNPHLASSHFQLARVYLREQKYTLALAEIDAAMKLIPENETVHYVRGQILEHLGRTQEARAEMQKVTGISNAAREKRHQELEVGPIPEPQLAQEPQ
jgi:tetratricopeptide (TPR) repeat protein